jgi:hypothetical protein
VHVVGSASLWVLGLVAGPRRTASLVHTGRDAAYLDLEGVCLAILGARAVQVPCGVRTLLPVLPDLVSGTPAVVHGGSIAVPGLDVMVTHLVDTTVPVLDPAAAARGATLVDGLAGDALDRVRVLLPEEPLAALAAADVTAVTGLLGLGGGLTPLGDDVLAGWLATAVASRHPALDEMRSAVALAARDRTTALSATLLSCAARGEGVPEFRSLLSGIVRADTTAVDRSLASMLRIGDTSGQGLVLGALTALASLPSTSSFPAEPDEGLVLTSPEGAAG